MEEEETFLITQGKIDIPNLQENAENLWFAIRKGYSDQDIDAMYDIVCGDHKIVEKKLKEAGVDV